MQRWAEAMIVMLVVACGAAGAAAQTDKTPPASSTPEEVVTRYLEALKAGNFAAAYDEISKEMAQHKDRESESARCRREPGGAIREAGVRAAPRDGARGHAVAGMPGSAVG